MTRLAIVILNYNGKKFLEKFLPSVLTHSAEHSVIVADNASTDESVAWLSAHYPSVEIITLSKNYGFAQGYNEALQQIDAEYYCLLNSDVEVTRGWIDPLLELLESSPKIAAVQPKILDYNRRVFFEHGGGVGGFIDTLGYPFTRGRIFDSREEDIGQYDTPPVQCHWSCGACMIVRADVFHRLEGFDGDFFAHMEEIDFCWRLQLAGYEVWATGESIVYHVGGGTLEYQSPRKSFLNFHNSLAMLYKNLPDHQLWSIIFIRLILDGVAGIFFLLSGFPKSCWAVAQAHFTFYWRWTMWRDKRRKLAALRNLNNPVMMYPESIVKSYFIQGIKRYSELVVPASPKVAVKVPNY